MRKHLLIALLVAAMPALAQQQDAPQQGLSTGQGSTTIAPRQTVVSEKADQIRARDALKASVFGADGKDLGSIDRILMSKDTGTIDVVRLGSGTVLAWNSLKFSGKPSPRFVAEASAAEARKNADWDKNQYIDVGKDLLGREAVGEDGKELGEVVDAVIRFGSGEPVAFLVQEGEKNPRVVAWSEARPGRLEGKHVLALSAEQLRRLPEYATMAPDPTEPPATSGSSLQTQPGTKLGTGEHSTPTDAAPDTRRR
jgi:sporulation protein YlmC with PRC-barrel domain